MGCGPSKGEKSGSRQSSWEAKREGQLSGRRSDVDQQRSNSGKVRVNELAQEKRSQEESNTSVQFESVGRNAGDGMLGVSESLVAADGPVLGTFPP